MVKEYEEESVKKEENVVKNVSNTVTNIFIKKLYSATCFSFSFFLFFLFTVMLLIVQVLLPVYGWERCTFDYLCVRRPQGQLPYLFHLSFLATRTQ